MTASTPKLKTCPKGHQFFKTSDCPTCPVCEAAKKPQHGFLSKISAPARRALESEGITTIEALSKRAEKDLLLLHGFGPASIPILKKELKRAGLTFRIK